MFKPVLAALDLGVKAFTAFLVVVLLGTVTAGVVFRAANHPLSWTDEAAGFLMIWVACLGWMIATRKRNHIRIRVFMDRLPRTAWNGTELVFQLCVAVIGGVLAWYSLHLIQVNSDIEATSMPISVAWMYVPMVPAGLTTLLQALVDIGRVLRGTAVPVASGDLP